jgi:hypothetical protein
MYVHGANLEQKEAHQSKYLDEEARRFLTEIRSRYDVWRKANEDLKGPGATPSDADASILMARVELLNSYKDFIDQQRFAEKFDSRSNLHSSILEEFMYYLFRDLVAELSRDALIGKSHTFKGIFFRGESYAEMLKQACVMIETKDHDFAIGARIEAGFKVSGQKTVEAFQLDVPAVAIECKTYLDKTMLQDAATAAEHLRHKNPNAIYIVVAEWLKLTESVNLKKYKIDQIYVLRKQKNTDREFRYNAGYEKNPIYVDVVEHLYRKTREFLTSPWEGGIKFGLTKGYLI